MINFHQHPRLFLLFTLNIILLMSSCTDSGSQLIYDETDLQHDEEEELSSEQYVFWAEIQKHCGKAYQGKLADATYHYLPFDESNIVLHIRECSDTLTHITLNISDDYSRNLMLTQTETTLRLKHDHRNPDGTEEEISQYGGDAPKPGLNTRQIFFADAHTAEILPKRSDNFWFLDMMNDTTLAYGVHWPEYGHSIRIKFDLSVEVESPPAPWGYN